MTPRLRMPFRIAALCSALAVSGCAIGPDYVEPESALPAQYGEATDAVFTKDESPADWWKGFGDPILNDLIVKAVEHNNDIDAAIARINQARALRAQAFLELLPGAQATGSYIKNRTAPVRFPGFSSEGFEYELYSVGFDARWEIDLFGRLRRDLEAARADEAAAVAGLHDAIRVLVADVARYYFQLRGAQLELDVTERNVRNQEETVSLAEARERAGETSELDTARARSQLLATRAAVPPLHATIKTSIHRLAVLLASQPSDLKPLLEAKAPVPLYQGPVGLADPTALLRRRPDLRRVERELAAATARIGVAVGDLYPKIAFEGSLSVEASSPSEWTSGQAAGYDYGPRLRWSILEFGRVLQRIRAADARAVEAVEAYEQAVLVALEEMENALVNFSTERLRREELKGAVEAGYRAFELAKVQYKAGATDFLTVLEAQRSVLQNEADLARSETQLATSLVAVYKALGGGWEEFPLTQPS